MKISVKTLSGETMQIEVELTDTVLNIKQKIQAIKNFEPSQQKLLRKGALISDEKTVQELGIQEGDFLVVMVNVKKQAPPQQQAQQQQPQQQQQPPQQQPPQQQQQQQAPQQQPPQQQPPQQQPPQQNINPPPVSQPQVFGESTLASGPVYEIAINEIVSMGFSKEEAQNAMRAAFNNPERAIEYLLNGIPQTPQTIPANQQQSGLGTSSPSSQSPQVGQAANQIFTQLMQNPQFQQIRAMAQQNPQAFLQMMPQLMQVLQQQNPQLYALIQQNPEAFMGALIGPGGGAGQQSVQIQLTEQEKISIDNIVGLGFTKNDALEAFLACERNEEQAVNYLFDKQERGDLLSQHIEREQNDPQNQGGDGPEEEEDDDDIYN